MYDIKPDMKPPCCKKLTFSDFQIIIYSDLLNFNMDDVILSISDRGQITIPYKLRSKMPVKHFLCNVEDNAIVLKPFQSRDEFLLELDEAEKDWEKNGGLSIEEMKKKHNIG